MTDPASLSNEKRSESLTKVDNWTIEEDYKLTKEYKFPDFAQALKFVNKIGKLAEEQGHHPQITFTWGYVKVAIWTHSISNLTENDFNLAAKIDKS